MENGVWVKPEKNQAEEWAAFLDQLNWPIKNRYIILFNEPNHAKEWGGTINPAEYAEIASLFIKTLKKTSPDFFVLNAGFDLAAPNLKNQTADALWYWQEMEKHQPGIFHLFDGWTSHSYPNPGFVANPYLTGRTSIVGYRFEQDYLAKNFGMAKKPVFITETGWVSGKTGLSEEQIAQFYQIAYQQIWTDENLIAVTPFLLNYPQPLFSAFSWQDQDGHPKKHYQVVASLTKQAGQPLLTPVSFFGQLAARFKQNQPKIAYIPDLVF